MGSAFRRRKSLKGARGAERGGGRGREREKRTCSWSEAMKGGRTEGGEIKSGESVSKRSRMAPALVGSDTSWDRLAAAVNSRKTRPSGEGHR